VSTHATYLRRGAVTLGAVTIGGFLADYAFNLGLTRFLTPHDYGDFKVAYAFVHFFGLAVLLGGDRAAPMVLAPWLQSGEHRRVWEYLRFYLGTALLLGLVLTAVIWTASWLHVGTLDPHHHHPLAWVVVAVPLSAVGAMVSRTLQSARMPAQAVLPWRIGLPVLQLAIFAVVIAVQGTLGLIEAVLIGVLATGAITAAQGLWVHRLGLVEIAREPGFPQARGWLVTSLPMMGSFLVALGLNQSDLYFLELLGDEAEVGYYAAAATAAHFLLLVQTTVVGLVAPLARPAIEAGEEASRSTYRHGQALMLRLAIPLAVVLALAAGPILELFKPEYRAAHWALVLLVLANLAWAAAALSSLWLQYQDRAGLVLAISIGTLVVDSALNLLLIPRYGMDGAAASTTVTLTVAAAALILARRTPARPPVSG
jgi:O-antigen/teichoic acid export membrane protein